MRKQNSKFFKIKVQAYPVDCPKIAAVASHITIPMKKRLKNTPVK